MIEDGTSKSSGYVEIPIHVLYKSDYIESVVQERKRNSKSVVSVLKRCGTTIGNTINRFRDHLTSLLRGYYQEIVLNNVDCKTKQNMVGYIRNLNLRANEFLDSDGTRVIVVDIGPIKNKPQMDDLLVYIENEKLKIARREEMKMKSECNTDIKGDSHKWVTKNQGDTVEISTSLTEKLFQMQANEKEPTCRHRQLAQPKTVKTKQRIKKRSAKKPPAIIYGGEFVIKKDFIKRRNSDIKKFRNKIGVEDPLAKAEKRLKLRMRSKSKMSFFTNNNSAIEKCKVTDNQILQTSTTDSTNQITDQFYSSAEPTCDKTTESYVNEPSLNSSMNPSMRGVGIFWNTESVVCNDRKITLIERADAVKEISVNLFAKYYGNNKNLKPVAKNNQLNDIKAKVKDTEWSTSATLTETSCLKQDYNTMTTAPSTGDKSKLNNTVNSKTQTDSSATDQTLIQSKAISTGLKRDISSTSPSSNNQQNKTTLKELEEYNFPSTIASNAISNNNLPSNNFNRPITTDLSGHFDVIKPEKNISKVESGSVTLDQNRIGFKSNESESESNKLHTRICRSKGDQMTLLKHKRWFNKKSKTNLKPLIEMKDREPYMSGGIISDPSFKFESLEPQISSQKPTGIVQLAKANGQTTDKKKKRKIKFYKFCKKIFLPKNQTKKINGLITDYQVEIPSEATELQRLRSGADGRYFQNIRRLDPFYGEKQNYIDYKNVTTSSMIVCGTEFDTCSNLRLNQFLDQEIYYDRGDNSKPIYNRIKSQPSNGCSIFGKDGSTEIFKRRNEKKRNLVNNLYKKLRSFKSHREITDSELTSMASSWCGSSRRSVIKGNTSYDNFTVTSLDSEPVSVDTVQTITHSLIKRLTELHSKEKRK